MSDNKTTVNLTPGWAGLLGVIFVIAKIWQIGVVATWSWWLVLLPFYFGFLLLVGIIILGAVGVTGVYAGLASTVKVIEWYKNRKYRK
jgi:hypothetical protein